jgi:hypothetical protein
LGWRIGRALALVENDTGVACFGTLFVESFDFTFFLLAILDGNKTKLVRLSGVIVKVSLKRTGGSPQTSPDGPSQGD